MTECTQPSFSFADHGRRQVVARFDGGTISSDGGAVLLRQLEQRTGIVRKFADCFHDYRQPAQIEHSVRERVCQRVYGRWRWVMRTSTITINCARTRCWLC